MDELQFSSLERKYNLKIKPEKDYYIKENHWLPRKLGIQYFAFGKTLYCNGKIVAIPDHEFLHIAQFRRFGIPRVIVHYLFYLAKNYISSFDFAQSFVNIPFEKEARYYEQLQKQTSLKNR